MIFRKVFLFALFLTLLLCACKKEPHTAPSDNASTPKLTQADIVAGKYLVSGTYSIVATNPLGAVEYDTSWSIHTDTMYITKVDSLIISISFQPYFSIDSNALDPTVLYTSTGYYNSYVCTTSFILNSANSITLQCNDISSILGGGRYGYYLQGFKVQ